MKLLKEVYTRLVSLPPAPPETGGIIGSENGIGMTICEDTCSEKNGFSYSPDVQFLNKTIEQWCENDVSLYAVYHTHIEGGYELSKQDKAYAEKIIRSMPDSIKQLYFPIVIPSDRVVAYKALKRGNQISIIKDKLVII